MKVLFIDSTHPILPEIFHSVNWEIIDGSKKSMQELEELVTDVDGIIIRSRFKLEKDFISKGKKLKFIGRPGAGLENIDTAYCKESNIQVFRSPEGNRDAVAEHAVGMLLMLFNKLNIANTEVKNGKWDRLANRGEEIMGKTVGLIGYGYMGEATAKRLKGFDCEVIAYDKYKTGFSDDYAKEVTLEELFEHSDIVSLHTPLTPETIGFFNDAFIQNFKKDFYLINTARGQSVVLKDLAQNIQSGKIKGACLDVLEVEKTTFESIFEGDKPDELAYLMQQENVIFSPHVAGWTHESNEKMARFLGEKIIQCYL